LPLALIAASLGAGNTGFRDEAKPVRGITALIGRPGLGRPRQKPGQTGCALAGISPKYLI
jgi:hypothetical protein